jgi:hypothetical protein
MKEKVLLKLLKYWKNYKPGDVVTVPAGILPERMIRNGVAARYVEKTTVSSSKQTKRKEKENGGDGNENL